MNISTCVSCQDVLSCEDSPLSVTGNIIGILTFAGALMISIQVYVNAMMNADRNMFEITNTFRSRVDEVESLKHKLQENSGRIDGHLIQRVEIALDRVRDLLSQAYALLERVDNRSYGGKRRLWFRAKFVLRADLVKEGLEKTAMAMDSLREVASDVFST